MGLATLLLRLGLKYNESRSLELVDRLFKFIKNTAYESSIDLAKEKGSFSRFDAVQYLKSGFTKTLRPSIREAIQRDGIRNCTLLTLAPTGTTAIVCDVDSGIEPAFGPGWIRRFRDGDELKSEVVIHPLFKEMWHDGRAVSHFQSSADISLRDHFEMQRICQRHIDNAVSKTLNVAQGTSIEELSELYMEYFPELKGVTVYPQGSREDQPITPISIDEAIERIDTYAPTLGATSADSCRSGVCEI
jgi:Ribonucleotide reductase, alpha subunit